MRKTILAFSAVVLGVFLLSSCSKDEKDRPAPVPPSVETIKPDFGALTSTKTTTSEFHSYVTTSVLYTWNFIFNSIIDIPLKGLEHISNHAGVLLEDGTWMWKDSFRDGLSTYTVALYGKYRNDETVDWEVRVSQDGIVKFQDFCWLTGWSSTDGKKGQWKVQAGPSQATTFVTSDWQTDGQYVTSVKLTYDLDLAWGGIVRDFNGSTLEVYRGATDSAYDSTIKSSYYQLGFGFVNVTIEWNQKTGAGRFMSDSNWGSAWHSWGSDKSDQGA